MYLASIIILFYNVSALALRPHHFPNGRPIKFQLNKDTPRKDLIELEPPKAAIITTN